APGSRSIECALIEVCKQKVQLPNRRVQNELISLTPMPLKHTQPYEAFCVALYSTVASSKIAAALPARDIDSRDLSVGFPEPDGYLKSEIFKLDRARRFVLAILLDSRLVPVVGSERPSDAVVARTSLVCHQKEADKSYNDRASKGHNEI